MNKTEHEESKRITAAATPGGWAVEDPIEGQLEIVEAGKQTYEWRFIASFLMDDAAFRPEEVSSNAAFVAHARTALPAYQQAAEEMVELLRQTQAVIPILGSRFIGTLGEQITDFLKRWDGNENA